MAEPLQQVQFNASEQASTRAPARPRVAGTPERQAYQALHLGFTVAPILAGADKFFDRLGNWDAYLAPVFPRILRVTPHSFMKGVGVIEIVAGIGVAAKPKIFGYVVAGWLGGIIVNLLIRGSYYDVALRDLGLAIGAFALARLATGSEKRAA